MFDATILQLQSTPARYAVARRERLLDRPNCQSPEVGIICDPTDIRGPQVAYALRNIGISVATYSQPLRRQVSKAKKDDVDQLLFVDDMRMRCTVTGEETQLSQDYAVDALNVLILAYLPLDWTAMGYPPAIVLTRKVTI